MIRQLSWAFVWVVKSRSEGSGVNRVVRRRVTEDESECSWNSQIGGCRILEFNSGSLPSDSFDWCLGCSYPVSVKQEERRINCRSKLLIYRRHFFNRACVLVWSSDDTLRSSHWFHLITCTDCLVESGKWLSSWLKSRGRTKFARCLSKSVFHADVESGL